VTCVVWRDTRFNQVAGKWMFPKSRELLSQLSEHCFSLLAPLLHPIPAEHTDRFVTIAPSRQENDSWQQISLPQSVNQVNRVDAVPNQSLQRFLR
jgi:hypothetical protein